MINELELLSKKEFLELDIEDFKSLWRELKGEILDKRDLYQRCDPEKYERELHILQSVLKAMDLAVSVKITERRIKDKVCQFCRNTELDTRGYGTLCTNCFNEYEERMGRRIVK